MNIRSSYFHMLTDLMGSIAVKFGIGFVKLETN
jgi:Co/Zn/Cd efflux system component